MATDDSGHHLPPSWPDAPAATTPPPGWNGSPAGEPPASWNGSASAGPPASWAGSSPASWNESGPAGASTSWNESAPAGPPMAWPEAPQPAGHDPSWPEPPRAEGSWPEPPRRPRHGSSPPPDGPRDTSPSWPEPPRPDTGWPEPPREPHPQQAPAHQSAPHQRASRQDVPPSWPGASPQDVPMSWPETPGAVPPSGVPGDRRAGQAPVPDPVPAWAQPPTPAPGAWSNLSSPGSRPHGAGGPAGDVADQRTATFNQVTPSGPAPHEHGPPPQNRPPEERTATYAQHPENLLNDRAAPSTPMDSTQTGMPHAEDRNNPHPGGHRPGSNLSRDPSDPENRFVTAGQISGSRTPPPERQQELWNTVFGDNYQAMGDHEALDDEEGKPVWIYALGGSVAIALVAALLWAFLAGPLAGEDAEGSASSATSTSPSAPAKPSATRTSNSIGPLPKYPGDPSPVVGRVPIATAGISVPRLGGDWQLDQRPTVKGTYGYEVRQYVQVAPEKYAQFLSGPLPQPLASYYEADNLEPVIKQVVLSARKTYFPSDNKVRKIAQQAIKVGDQTGRLIAYSLTSETERATIVTMAVNTDGTLPAIVYMSIPAENKKLLPDIRTVMNQLRLTAGS
ncbi:MAG TPA: hypothetical protein VFV66_13145 [Nonomuraea sp.]|nr:hypothetical protein [Nonomuraea sp.]